MSFRRHYGTGSYSSSLLSSPLSSSYGSRGLGGYSSAYSNYGGSYYGGYGGKTHLSRSASLPRDNRGSSVPRYSSAYSRGSSPSRSVRSSVSSRGSSPPRSLRTTASRLSRFEQDSSDSSSSGVDSPINPVRRSNSNRSDYDRTSYYTSSLVPRAYSRDYGTVYSSAKGFIRSSRSKSVGSSSSLSSGYGSNSGSVSERGEATKGSTTSLGSALNSRPSSRASSLGPENGDIDYKKLYEEQLEENFRVHERLRDTENELRQTRETVELNNKKNNTRLAMAEADKREKRALERKLSEMEEELKQLQKLKAENEKLKAENRALTRVVSKLTNSATAGMGNLAALSK